MTAYRSFALALVASAALYAAGSPEQIEFFEKKVRPVLVNKCYACHSAETKPAGGLRVDDRNGLLRGGESGPAVVPGNPAQGTLLKRIQHQDPKRRMPKEGDPVTDAELAALTAWIRDGVAWPEEQIQLDTGRLEGAYQRMRARHWAFQPLKSPEPPALNSSWIWNDVDRFVLAKLQERKLQPVRDADRVTLIRRLTFDLTGLPPTPAETDAFVSDKRPDAYERLVDRLLQSRRFAERWARHWLDVARYGESTGPSRNIPYPHAWRYRDYVIDAIDRDIPYNRFIEEQIAGDLLPAADAAERDRLLAATGFLAIGPKDVNQRFKERFVMDNVDEQIDTVTRSTLALTVSCARCHDHKFDPVPIADYYALAGIFTSTELAAGLRNKMGGAGLDYYDHKALITLTSTVPPPPADKLAKLQAEVAIAKKEWDAIRGTPEGLALDANGRPKQRQYRLRYERLQFELLSLTDPATRGYAVHGVREGKEIGDTAIRIRGQAERLGPVVPRGFLTAFTVPNAPKINPAQSGRLELAQWITNPQNPLTARVFVNRVWSHLFGKGIVSTVDNFGRNGDRPSHPELLDYLASKFIRDGWSLKRLVRDLVMSHTYRLSADKLAANQEADPENRLLWRHSPRRLEAEEIRDAMLASAGRLELRPPAGSAVSQFKMVEIRDNGLESRSLHEAADRSVYRSIYLPLARGITPRSLEPFDPVSQTLVTGQRDGTTVPTQALYLLNSAFVRRQALALANSLLSDPKRTTEQRIRQAYRLVLNRLPTSREIARAAAFLKTAESAYATKPPKAPVAAAASLPPPQPDDPDDPDNVDRTEYALPEESVQADNARSAAWLDFIQALYASAEFRFIR